jgi:hypothetical protein
MNVLFKALRFLLAGYVVIAVLSRAVYTKSGMRGRTFLRMGRLLRYRPAIAADTVRSAALMF